MTDVNNRLRDYLDETRDDEPTVRFVKTHSSPTIEMQAEVSQMCLDILDSVPEPIDSTEKVLWKQAQQSLRALKKEIVTNDVDATWTPAPRPSRSAQQSRKVTHKGFRIREEIK
jgi:hypothetical protein